MRKYLFNIDWFRLENLKKCFFVFTCVVMSLKLQTTIHIVVYYRVARGYLRGRVTFILHGISLDTWIVFPYTSVRILRSPTTCHSLATHLDFKDTHLWGITHLDFKNTHLWGMESMKMSTGRSGRTALKLTPLSPARRLTQSSNWLSSKLCARRRSTEDGSTSRGLEGWSFWNKEQTDGHDQLQRTQYNVFNNFL